MHLLPGLTLPITDPLATFAVVVVIILIVPVVAQRLGVPAIVGLILAGVLVGPSVADVLERDRTIDMIGAVGLLYIMFVAGLDINLTHFIRHRRRSFIFGGLTFAIPQCVGTVLAVYLLGFAWLPAVLLASMLASHTLLAYPIAGRLGIGRSDVVTTTVGGTILADTAALTVLMVVARSVSGSLSAVFWVRLFVAALFFMAVVFWLLPRAARWFFRRQGTESGTEFVFVLAALLLSALLARFAGMEPIIGAFMAGLALSRLVPEQSVLMNRIHFVGNALFIPFFLISVGMLVDVRAFAGGLDGWILAAFMVLTVVAAKFAAAEASRRILHFSPDEGRVMFGLSVAQAAATLAAVVVGYDLGIFGEPVLNGTILMILVTCLVSPWVVDTYGRRVALALDLNAPSERTPSQRILVPLSNPATAATLMDVAVILRRPEDHEPIHPMVVVLDHPGMEERRAASERLLAQAVATAAAADVPVYPVTRIDLNVADGIVRTVHERRITHVVAGWNGEVSAGERIFGSVVDQLLRATREHVVVCKIQHAISTLGRIRLLIPPPCEQDPGFLPTLHLVTYLASQLGADLLIHSALNEGAFLRQLPPNLRTAVDFRFAARFGSLSEALEDIEGVDDLVVVVNSREGSVSWHPSFDRIPRQLAARDPAIDFMIAYLPLWSPERTTESPAAAWTPPMPFISPISM